MMMIVLRLLSPAVALGPEIPMASAFQRPATG